MKKIFQITRRRMIFLIVLLVFLSWQSLTLSGFCYAERRWLSEQEVIDRYLLMNDKDFFSQKVGRSKWNRVGFKEWLDEPPKEAEKRMTENREKYEGCCTVYEPYYHMNKLDIWLNSLGAWYMFEIHTYFPRAFWGNNRDTSHYYQVASVNACSTRVHRTFGEGISEKEYDLYKNVIKKRRQGRK